MKTRMLKCECSACGYVARTTRRWLIEYGPPLCPCNGEPMRDALADMVDAVDQAARDDEREAAAEAWGRDPSVPRPMRSRFVVVDRSRACWECGRDHDRGALMVQSSAHVDGRIACGYFCAVGEAYACDALGHVDYSGDLPPHEPANRCYSGMAEPMGDAAAEWAQRRAS